MSAKQNIPASGLIVFILLLANVLILRIAYTENENLYWLLLITLPLLILALYNRAQKSHALLRNYPVIGYLRYFLESVRPELRQYFFESDLDGKPFNRRQRSIIYQRAKNEKQTVAFGMQSDPNVPGYEFVAHSIYPVTLRDEDLRVRIGNYQCLQPYRSSILNIGAMSYGALSKTAIEALNRGARLGSFAHNTGEGGISSYHLNGADLIWQIGTGYFGCRNSEGRFDPIVFRKTAIRPEIKMIELKLSQGAKPGHGGILPAAKNTQEIAEIRLVNPNTTVHSPASHGEFDSSQGMLEFLQLLRELSGGKPVGFKLCIGDKKEFIDICQSIKRTGIIPDFITVDGAEGGTGAAPLEFTDNIGMPLYEALVFVRQTLESHQLYQHISIIAAGKIVTGFDVLKVIALGASSCYSARGMMFALGCIQALTCDSGRCPVGVATQNPHLYNALDPADKGVRVYNYHQGTIKGTKEIMEACGFRNIKSVNPSKFFIRISDHKSKSFEELFFTDNKTHLNNDYKTVLN